MKRNVPAAALCAALAALAVAGCGGSDKKSSSSSSQPAPAPAPSTSGSSGGGAKAGGKGSNLTIAADSSGQLKFDKKSLSAKAGKVTITMDNPSPVPHAIAVEGNGLDKDGNTVQMGGKSTVTVTLKAGKYTFYCPVDGHKQAGMQGPLTVK
jgi:plastocyanin